VRDQTMAMRELSRNPIAAPFGHN